MKTLTLLFAASMALGACAAPHLFHHKPKPEDAAPAPKAVEARPVAPPLLDTTGAKPKPGMDWAYVEESGLARLSYGGSGGPGTKLMLTCAHNSGVMTVQRPVPASSAAGPAKLVLASGSAHSTELATAQPGPDAGTVLLTAKFATLEALPQAFLRTGVLGVQDGDKLDAYVAQKDNTAVRRWFAYCGA